MPDIKWTIQTKGFDGLAQRFDSFPRHQRRVTVRRLETLGNKVKRLVKEELADTKTTGKLERSIVAEVGSTGTAIEIYPKAEHAIFVRTGTRPHWAPIGPLKRWAARKLGNERAAYPIRVSIARHGTSMFQKRKRGTKTNPWPKRVLLRTDFRQHVQKAATDIGQDLVVRVVRG